MSATGIPRASIKTFWITAAASPAYRMGAALCMVVLALAITRLAAVPLRRELMIEEPGWAPAANREAPEAREEGDRFFAQRDSVLVRVPADMTVGEFVRLYHLRNTRGVREALQAQLGAFNDADPLRKGAEVRLHLTVPTQ